MKTNCSQNAVAASSSSFSSSNSLTPASDDNKLPNLMYLWIGPPRTDLAGLAEFKSDTKYVIEMPNRQIILLFFIA